MDQGHLGPSPSHPPSSVSGMDKYVETLNIIEGKQCKVKSTRDYKKRILFYKVSDMIKLILKGKNKIK